MSSNDKKTTIFNSNTYPNRNLVIDKIKTTNVNILLNRVRLDKKKTLKKRIFFSVILITLVGSLAAYFVI